MISPQEFIHPEDETARRNMEAIPGFATAAKAFCRCACRRNPQMVRHRTLSNINGEHKTSAVGKKVLQLPGTYGH